MANNDRIYIQTKFRTRYRNRAASSGGIRFTLIPCGYIPFHNAMVFIAKNTHRVIQLASISRLLVLRDEPLSTSRHLFTSTTIYKVTHRRLNARLSLPSHCHITSTYYSHFFPFNRWCIILREKVCFH
jgi:hypothetical protein